VAFFAISSKGFGLLELGAVEPVPAAFVTAAGGGGNSHAERESPVDFMTSGAAVVVPALLAAAIPRPGNVNSLCPLVFEASLDALVGFITVLVARGNSGTTVVPAPSDPRDNGEPLALSLTFVEFGSDADPLDVFGAGPAATRDSPLPERGVSRIEEDATLGSKNSDGGADFSGVARSFSGGLVAAFWELVTADNLPFSLSFAAPEAVAPVAEGSHAPLTTLVCGVDASSSGFGSSGGST
jgi:hypothetical protein